MQKEHFSVLLNETIDALELKADGIYVDLTLGMGGHSAKILEKIPNGLLIAFDKDAFAIEESRQKLQKIRSNFHLIHSDFKNISEELAKMKINKVDGIIADLGISSPQVDNSKRGFSYNKDSRLDMRMDTNQKLDAHYIVNHYSIEEIERILINNAEVKLAKRVANAIVQNRPINSTIELANVVRKAYPAKLVKLKNPNKAIFQALRIEVNNELESLKHMLSQITDLLKVKGKLAIITFHSLEDRIVKNFFKQLNEASHPVKMPINETKKYNLKNIRASEQEIKNNRRSRSAKLRILTKLI